MSLTVDVQLISAGDPRWDEQIEPVHHDVYHRSGYHRFSAETQGAQAWLVAVRDTRVSAGVVWPYMLRPVDGTSAFDVDSVYGYPGPLGWGYAPADPFARAAGQAIAQTWIDQGAVTAFTRFHPILGNTRWGLDLPFSGPDGDEPIRQIGETVAIDLRQNDADIFAGYQRKLRQEIAAARRAGLTTRLDEEWSSLETFAELYRRTMFRNRAGAMYFFTIDQLGALRRELGSSVRLFTTELDGTVAAAGLFMEHLGFVQAHLAGSDDDFRRHSPIKVLFDDVRRWAAERGNRFFHLGGGRGGRADSLFAFKTRFSGLRHAFHVGRWVLDPVAYDSMVAAWRRRMSLEEDDPDRGYFPTYRRPDAGSGIHEAPESTTRRGR